MIKFKDFFEQKKPKKLKSEMKARHMHPIGLDPNSHPKHPGRFVPKMHQVKQENPKLTRMKAGTSKREILASWDVKQITRQFELSPDINKPKKLGNTGIIMRYEPRYKKFILESYIPRESKIVNTQKGPMEEGIVKVGDNLWRRVWDDGCLTYNWNSNALLMDDLHKLDGPAYFSSPQHSKLYEQFWIHGKKFKGEDYWKQPEVLLYKKLKPEDRQTGADLLDI